MNNSLSKEDILHELIPIFVKVFGDAGLIIDENTNAYSVDTWNSLNHMILMTEVEKRFGITIEPLDVLKAKSVRGLVDVIIKSSF